MRNGKQLRFNNCPKWGTEGMMEKSPKRCENAGCSMRSMTVTTDKTDCIGCGKKLKDIIGDMDLSGIFGDMFKGRQNVRQIIFGVILVYLAIGFLFARRVADALNKAGRIEPIPFYLSVLSAFLIWPISVRIGKK